MVACLSVCLSAVVAGSLEVWKDWQCVVALVVLVASCRLARAVGTRVCLAGAALFLNALDAREA